MFTIDMLASKDWENDVSFSDVTKAVNTDSTNIYLLVHEDGNMIGINVIFPAYNHVTVIGRKELKPKTRELVDMLITMSVKPQTSGWGYKRLHPMVI